MESLDDRIAIALNAKFDKRSAALDKSVELLDALTRVAEEALQPPPPPKSVALGLTTVARSLYHHPCKAARTRSQPVVSPSTLVGPRLHH